MKLALVAVGRLRATGAAGAAGAAGLARDYAERLGHYASLDLVEVKAARGGRGAEIDRAVEEEGARLLAAFRPDDRVVLFDERGRELSSRGLADFLAEAERTGGPRRFVFLVGGAWGVSRAVRDRAERTLSLSKMTLPHELARVVALEQLYRAFTILRGEPYHHA